jgi:hypothetical protein
LEGFLDPQRARTSAVRSTPSRYDVILEAIVDHAAYASPPIPPARRAGALHQRCDGSRPSGAAAGNRLARLINLPASLLIA